MIIPRLLFLLLFFFDFCKAQPPNIQWAKCLGGSAADLGWSIVQLKDGGFVVAGVTTSPNNGDVSGLHTDFGPLNDMWILRLDSVGGLLWQKCLGGSIEEGAVAIKQTFDNGFIITGFASSSDYDVAGGGIHGNDYDYWIVKTDSLCNIQWQKCFGGTYYDYAKDIIQTNDSGYVVVGYVESLDGDITSSYGGQDIWVVKFNTLGNITWKKLFGGSNEDQALAVRESSDGSLIIAGSTRSSDHDISFIHPGPIDAWVLKLDSIGNLIWQKCYGGTDGEGFTSLGIDHSGNYLFVGWTYSNDGDVSGMHGSGDGWVIKTDTSGQILSQKCVGGLNGDILYSIDINSDNSYILAGWTASFDSLVMGNNGFTDYYILKTDSSENIEWYKCYGGSDLDDAYSICSTKDGGYAIVGWTFSNDGDVSGHHPPNNEWDIWVVKLFPLQDEINQAYNIADNFSCFLSKSNNQLFISYYSGVSENINVELLDITGRVLARQKVNIKSGLNTNSFPIGVLSFGNYIVRLTTKNGMVTKLVFNE